MNPSRVLYVIPVYNAEAWLDECIRSVLEQDYADIQILCIDDGSIDDSIQILDRYSHSLDNFSYLSQANAGPGVAFNRGIEYAKEKGIEFIARMDADDISLPFRTRLQVGLMEKNPDVGACSCSADYFLEKRESVGSSLVPSVSDEIRNEIYAGGRGLIQGATLFRTAFLSSIGGYRAHKTPAEDTDIFLRLAEICPLMNVPEVAYKIRICGTSHSLNDIYNTRLYHHYYLHLSKLRLRGLSEIGFGEYKSGLSWLNRLLVRQEAASMKEYFQWMSTQSKCALAMAAILDPKRTIRRVVKKMQSVPKRETA